MNMKALMGVSRETNGGDRLFNAFLRGVGIFVLLIFATLVGQLLASSEEALREFGWGFWFESHWDPMEDDFSALSFVYGTLITSLLALAMAAPPCIALALFTTELCPAHFRSWIAFMIEMLAAIPSIIYGMWALFFLAPMVREYVYPFLNGLFPGWALFRGPSFGLGLLTSALILAIMISPIIATITTQVFLAVPRNQRYAAFALGATRWEMMKLVLLRPSAKGIGGAMVLALGRALGETMAVAMVIGNAPEIASSLFGAGTTMASVIANEYAEASSDLHLSALSYVALLLFFITFLVNSAAQSILKESKGN